MKILQLTPWQTQMQMRTLQMRQPQTRMQSKNLWQLPRTIQTQFRCRPPRWRSGWRRRLQTILQTIPRRRPRQRHQMPMTQHQMHCPKRPL